MELTILRSAKRGPERSEGTRQIKTKQSEEILRRLRPFDASTSSALRAQTSQDDKQELLPAIIQDAKTGNVLMLGYMNQEALQKTIETKWVTFYSRSKERLWVKGETSGHKLKLVNIARDCDSDALLISVEALGPTCHTGDTSCFGKTSQTISSFILQLENLLEEREQVRPEKSYVTTLFNAGISKIAQKVGEEGVEVALAALDKNDALLCEELADLFFHMLVLIKARKLSIRNVIDVLQSRNGASL